MKETITLSNHLFQFKVNVLKDGISLSQRVSDIVAQHLSNRPFHLNVIEAACHGSFKETGHSRVLADMLRHPLIQASFLDTFLGLKHNELEVTAEKDRIDVALKGKDLFIIVENKVNAAEEQKNQVYRYVHEIGLEKYHYDISQVYVIYLNPTNRNIPSDYSLCDENNKNNVFKELGEDHYTIQSYKNDITEWLRNISIPDEPHINSALDQYIDFLENKFHTSPLDKNMNNELNNILLKELHVEDCSLEAQIQALDNQYAKTEELLLAIESLKNEKRKELSHQLMREWQKAISQQLDVKLAEDDHSFGLKLNNQVWLGIWDGYDSADHRPYWGFELDSFRRDSDSNLVEIIEKILKIVGINHYHKENKEWIAWCTTEKGVERYMSLYKGAKQLGLI